MFHTAQPARLPVLDRVVWTASALAGKRPRQGPLRGGVGAGRFGHSEWSALLGRFVVDGAVDYPNLVRVRRLVEVYLGRLAAVDPESFIDADDQLAFYLNAYNTIALDQVLRAYPVRSILEIPGAMLRPYPIGRRNLSLQVLHGSVLRAFGDPRVHAAIAPAARGGPRLRSTAFTGGELQAQLDAAMRDFLADEQRGIHFDAAANTLWLSPLVAWLGGDWHAPAAMPGIGQLLRGRLRLGPVLNTLRPALPPAISAALDGRPRLRVRRFDWQLNAMREPITSR